MNENFDQIIGPVYRACNPQTPAGPNEYVDCASARGGDHFARHVIRHLQLEGEPHCFLFAGHIGCGKSSELGALSRQLKSLPAKSARCVPVLVDSLQYLDINNSAAEDVLLMLAAQIAETLRVDHQINLAEGMIGSRWRELKQLLGSDIEIGETGINAGAITAKLKLNRHDSEARERLRTVLRPRQSSLRDLIAESIGRAEDELYSKYEVKVKLVLIVDNLEKIESFDGVDGRYGAQKQLFIERSFLFTGLPATVIYSLSIDLARGQSARLQASYGSRPFILPMVKVFPRHQPEVRAELGYGRMREMLRLRTVEALGGPKEIFQPDALDLLIRYTGGDVRQFFQYVRVSLRAVDTLPVGESAVRYAIGQLKATYATTVAENNWSKLVELDASPTCDIANHDQGYLELLEQGVVLEYINGEGADNSTTWYAVHPVVRELERFKSESAKTRT